MNNESKHIPEFILTDRKSFQAMFGQYYSALCLFANTIVPDRDEVEEIVQGFFVKLWEKRESIVIESSVKNYLFGSVRNLCYNYIKHEKVKRGYEAEVINEGEAFDTSDYCMENELREAIENVMKNLAPRKREIFLLSRGEGLKYQEIADKLGISIKTVETQMGFVLKEFRTKLSMFRN